MNSNLVASGWRAGIEILHVDELMRQTKLNRGRKAGRNTGKEKHKKTLGKTQVIAVP